jgi:CBS domain-containing protein
MKVRDFCSPNVVTAEPGASLREASLAMRNAHVGALVVVERQQGVARPVGILTDRDIVVAVIAVPGARPESIRVCDAMSTRLAVAREDGGLLGIVTLDDLLGMLSTELANLAEALRWSRKRELAARHSIELG